jgi:hypothetical protein
LLVGAYSILLGGTCKWYNFPPVISSFQVITFLKFSAYLRPEQNQGAVLSVWNSINVDTPLYLWRTWRIYCILLKCNSILNGCSGFMTCLSSYSVQSLFCNRPSVELFTK